MSATYVETSGVLSNQVITRPAMERQGLIVSNNSDTVMMVAIGSTASAVRGVPLYPNSPASRFEAHGADAPNAAVSLFCAGANKAYTIYEW